MRAISFAIVGAAVLAALFLAILLVLPPTARAAGPSVDLDQQGCLEYAIWSGDLVWAREIGADRELTRASLKEMRAESDSQVFVLLLRDLDDLWATRASRNDVMQAVAQECIARRGKYDKLIES